MDADALFKNKRVIAGRLVPFGFSKGKSAFSYSARLLDGQFEMTVSVTRDGKVAAQVLDALTNEPYILHRLSDAAGAFVGTVREQYLGVLAKIADACFEPDFFKSEGARDIIEYVRGQYGDELEFLWERFPNNAIFRRKDNTKWYAALLTVKRAKLGLDGDGSLEVVDLRMAPEDIEKLVDREKYFPGYHMNKRHWITICLDGSVPQKEIHHRIDLSHALAAKDGKAKA